MLTSIRLSSLRIEVPLLPLCFITTIELFQSNKKTSSYTFEARAICQHHINSLNSDLLLRS